MLDRSEYMRRRERLLERIGPGVLLLASAPVAIRNNDVEHAYRQDSDLHYLTGFDEPESLLLLTNQHEQHRSVLFLRRRDKERETWDGHRLGVERAPQELGVDAAFAIDELEDKLVEYLKDVQRLHVELNADPERDRLIFRVIDRIKRMDRSGVTAPSELVFARREVHEMRVCKSELELSLMAEAADISREAHERAMQVALPGRHEYEVEAEMLAVFRRRGAERPAYESIVGSGDNATILHYRKNDRKLQDGDLLLIDAGAEYGYYASDVTRTFPVVGRFSPPQRQIYELVLEAQRAAIDAVRPGVSYKAVHEAALAVLARGLVELSVIAGPVEEAIAQERYKPYFMHGTSHWLGMDVHDVGRYYVDKEPRRLQPGMVMTIEPGLYFAAGSDSPFTGIGVRIEDNVVVTPDGARNLTAAIPKDPDELESLLSARSS